MRLAARIVDTPCNEMNTDIFLEVCSLTMPRERLGWAGLAGRHRPQAEDRETWGLSVLPDPAVHSALSSQQPLQRGEVGQGCVCMCVCVQDYAKALQ